MNLRIRETKKADREIIYKVESLAFGMEKEAELTHDLLGDPTAKPYVSLLAFDGDKPVGHILFTAAQIEGSKAKVSLLAPLAVVPEVQCKGIGQKLIKAGLKILEERGTDVVFVLGHPGYYPKAGFTPAYVYKQTAPYPIPDEFKDAWMVQALGGADLESLQGSVKIAEALDKPEHWQE